MCGVVAYIGNQQCLPILMEGLSRVEYRGYDSAGVVVHGPKGLKVVKKKGKLRELEGALPKTMTGTLGIGHTRWFSNHDDGEGYSEYLAHDVRGWVSQEVSNGIAAIAAGDED